MLRKYLVCFMKQKGQALISRPWEDRFCPSQVSQGSSWGQQDVRVSNAKCRKTVKSILVSPSRDEEETKSRASKQVLPGRPQWQKLLSNPR